MPIKFENFDGAGAPSLPSGWTFASGLVTTSTLGGGLSPRSSPNVLLLAATGTSAYKFGVYNTADSNGGDVSVQGYFASPTITGVDPQAWGVIARASATSVTSTSGSYYWGEVEPETGTVTLWKVVSGTKTSITPGGNVAASLSAGVWYLAVLTCVGTAISLAVQRQSDSQWLNSSGSWQAGQATAVAVADSAVAGAGFAGLTLRSRSDDSYADDWTFSTAAAPVPTPPAPPVAPPPLPPDGPPPAAVRPGLPAPNPPFAGSTRLTQEPARTLVRPADANLRLTQEPARTLVRPADAGLRVTQVAVRVLVRGESILRPPTAQPPREFVADPPPWAWHAGRLPDPQYVGPPPKTAVTARPPEAFAPPEPWAWRPFAIYPFGTPTPPQHGVSARTPARAAPWEDAPPRVVLPGRLAAPGTPGSTAIGPPGPSRVAAGLALDPPPVAWSPRRLPSAGTPTPLSVGPPGRQPVIYGLADAPPPSAPTPRRLPSIGTPGSTGPGLLVPANRVARGWANHGQGGVGGWGSGWGGAGAGWGDGGWGDAGRCDVSPSTYGADGPGTQGSGRLVADSAAGGGSGLLLGSLGCCCSGPDQCTAAICVTGCPSGTPLAGATVTVTFPDGTGVACTTALNLAGTAACCSVALAGHGAGSYPVTVSCPGYTTATATLPLACGGTATVALQPQGSSLQLCWTVQGCCSGSGYDTGQLEPGVKITLRCPGGTQTCLTDDAGQCCMTVAIAGSTDPQTCTWTAEKDRYQTQTGTVQIPPCYAGQPLNIGVQLLPQPSYACYPGILGGIGYPIPRTLFFTDSLYGATTLTYDDATRAWTGTIAAQFPGGTCTPAQGANCPPAAFQIRVALAGCSGSVTVGNTGVGGGEAGESAYGAGFGVCCFGFSPEAYCPSNNIGTDCPPPLNDCAGTPDFHPGGTVGASVGPISGFSSPGNPPPIGPTISPTWPFSFTWSFAGNDGCNAVWPASGGPYTMTISE